jgi:hypothetical protein
MKGSPHNVYIQPNHCQFLCHHDNHEAAIDSLFFFFSLQSALCRIFLFSRREPNAVQGTTRSQRSNDCGCPFQGYQRTRVPHGTYRRFVQIAHSARQQHHHFLEICVTAHADRSGILTRRGGENSNQGCNVMYSCQGCGGTCLRRRVAQAGLEVPFSVAVGKICRNSCNWPFRSFAVAFG